MAKKYLDDNGLLYFWGKIKATFALISHTHTKSEITDFPSTMTPSSHTHGNITNAGALQTTDVAIATGDKLVITDASNSSKVARASLTFDGSTATKALTQKGTFETFLTSADIPEGASASTTTPAMDGTATAGTETSFARGDHVHPTDTSRQADLGLTSADVTKWNNGIKLVDGSNTGYITGSSIIYNDDTIDYKISYTTDGGTTTKDITLVESTSLDYMGSVITRMLVPKTTTVNGHALSGDVTVTASDVSAIHTDQKGAASGVCPLNASSKIDATYLPSYVDDVIEAYARSGQTALSQNWLATGSATGTVITPETGKIYILMADSGDYAANTQFRWSGTTYVKMADGGVSSITNAEIDTIVAA